MFKSATSLAALASLIGTTPLSIPFATAAQAAPYVKVCNSGFEAGKGNCPANPVLGSGPNSWACTLDKGTGLLWEVKVPSLTDLRGFRNTYTNYDDTMKPQRNGTRPTQLQINGPSNSIGFVNSVNAASLCNQRDWERPSHAQLSGIIYPAGAPVKLDVASFPEPTFQVPPYGQTYPNTPTITSTGTLGQDPKYQSISFYNGLTQSRGRHIEALIRLVSRRCQVTKSC